MRNSTNFCLALIGVALAAACSRDEAPRVPESLLVVDDSIGRIVNAAVPSPDGSRIAYAKVIDRGRSTIFVSDADGSNPARISHGVWDNAPTWSPDGKWIAYQGEEPDFDLYVVASDGSVPTRRLTSGPGREEPFAWLRDGSGVVITRRGTGDEATMVVPINGLAPYRLGPVMQGNMHGNWSPDGSMLAFDVHQGAGSTIWVQDSATGSTPRQLTTEGMETAASQTTWSPDSKQLVYQSQRTGTSDIWILDVTTGQARQLTNDVRADVNPRWSPDGRSITFISDRGGQRDLWVMPSAGGTATRLTNDAAFETSPRWAPDGKSVYYMTNQNEVALEFVPVAGGPSRTLRSWSQYQLGRADLSPDGKTVIYDGQTTGNFDIYSLPVAGGEPVVLASSSRTELNPRYSPDGTQIAFGSDRGGPIDLWIMPATGGEPRNLTSAPGDESEFTWSPDGSHIAFTSSRDVGGWDLWTIPVTGGSPTRITQGNMRPEAPQWSPDGKYLYFVGEKPGSPGERDYFRVPATGGRMQGLGAMPGAWGRLSHDGTRIAYHGRERGWAFIYELPATGGPSRRITSDTSDVYQIVPEWTNNDSVLVIQSYDLAGNRDAADLVSYRLANGKWEQLTRTAYGAEEVWGFTPDGKDILVVRRTNRQQLRRVSVVNLVSAAATEK